MNSPLPTPHSPLATPHSPLFGLPVFAFALVSLWWLAAAAVPIVIHLWTRQRYREMPWAAMEYLLAAIRRHTRRVRFEQLLLLAVRTLLIVLLVLAVAEPFFKDIIFSSAAAGRTHRVLVIDGSYSMAYQPAEKSRFDRARELARQIVEAGRQGDACTLLLMSSPPQVVVGKPALEPDEVLEEIDNLRLPHTTADLPATVTAVLQVIEEARREDPDLDAHEVYFLTDLGRVGWAPELSEAAAADFQKRSKALAEAATLVVIDLGQPDCPNLALTGLRTAEPVATLAAGVDLQATVKNFASKACKRQRVELLVDGLRVAEKYVGAGEGGLPPGREVQVRFSHRFQAPGDHRLEARLLPDPQLDALDVDNHRFLALPVKRFVRVLCVNGRPSGRPFQDATDFLKVALSPSGQQADGSTTQVEVVPESALREYDLGRYDCIFLADVAQFLPSEARRLDSYLKHGGGLVFFLGDQVDRNNYNEMLAGDRSGGVRILPARLGPKAEEGQYRLDPLGYRHPIVADFRAREQAGLLITPINRYFKLKLPKDSKAKVALAIPSGDPPIGDPLIVEETIHRGRVVLVATSADRSWTPMPYSPCYVPIVQELLAFAIGGGPQQRNVLVGQTLGASIPTPAADVPVRLQTPDARGEKLLRLRPEGDYSSWSFSETTTSGIYAARLDPPLSRVDLFAVNVDPVESDLTKLSPEELHEQVWAGIDFETSREDLGEEPVRRISRRGVFSRALLYAVLGLLFLETLLAWLFGHHPT